MTGDGLTHARKTVLSTDLSYGKTVGTWCGKRRARAETPVGPEGVTCPVCRVAGANNELDLATQAEAVSELGCALHLSQADPLCVTCQDSTAVFLALAGEHRAAARVWHPKATVW